MSVTRYADVGDQVPEIWAADLLAEAEDLTFWQRFEGPEGSSMPIIRKDELEKEPGDTIRFDVVLSLQDDGIEGDEISLEGNEEDLRFRQQSMTVEAWAKGVRWTHKAKTLMTHSLRENALGQLSKYVSGKLDDDIFAEFTGANATGADGATFGAGNATTEVSIDATDLITLDDISNLKAYAQSDRRIEPLRMDNGDEYFGLVLHPYAALELKKSAEYQQAQREAQTRGSDNPLFTGSVAMWDGVILYTSNRVPRGPNGAADAQAARNIFFGAQAMVRGYAYYPDWVEAEFDYAREFGVATKFIKGERLITFDFSDAEDTTDVRAIGSIVYYSAAPGPTVP